MARRMDLTILPGVYTICRFPPDTPAPVEETLSRFFSVTRTGDELSIIATEQSAPAGGERSAGWRIIKVNGPLDFLLTGVLASIIGPLAKDGISIFAMSTFETDYILVRRENLSDALDTLRAAGHMIQ